MSDGIHGDIGVRVLSQVEPSIEDVMRYMTEPEVKTPIRLLLLLLFTGTFLVLSVIPDGASVLSLRDLLGVKFVGLILGHSRVLSEVVHFFVFAALTLLCAWALKPLASIKTRIVAAFVVASTFGVLVELIQIFIPQRTCDLSDMMLNVVGALVGGLALYGLTLKGRPA